MFKPKTFILWKGKRRLREINWVVQSHSLMAKELRTEDLWWLVQGSSHSFSTFSTLLGVKIHVNSPQRSHMLYSILDSIIEKWQSINKKRKWLIKQVFLKFQLVLDGVASWIKQPGPQLRVYKRHPVDVSLTHWSFSPSLSPSLLLSKNKWKNIFKNISF